MDGVLLSINPSAAESLGHEISELIGRNLAFNALTERPYTLSISLGVVPFDIESGIPLDEIIAQADASMYQHKRNKSV